jgi:hypothetical protein
MVELIPFEINLLCGQNYHGSLQKKKEISFCLLYEEICMA